MDPKIAVTNKGGEYSLANNKTITITLAFNSTRIARLRRRCNRYLTYLAVYACIALYPMHC